MSHGNSRFLPKESRYHLARYLFSGLWYATFCLAVSISYNSWFFSKVFETQLHQFCNSCQENTLALYAMVQVELCIIIFCLALMHKHFLLFYTRRILYVDLLIMFVPWAVLVTSLGVSTVKDKFIKNIQKLNCTGQDIPVYNFIGNVCYIDPLTSVFTAMKVILFLYLAISGRLARRYRFMCDLDKGLMGYFYTFILEILVSTHYQIYQSKSQFSVTDFLALHWTFHPVQLLLYFPVVFAQLIIYKNMVDPVNFNN